jgi:hypothetical protein
MAETGLNDMGLATQTSSSLAKLTVQVVEVEAAHISEFNMLEITPDTFIRIKSLS